MPAGQAHTDLRGRRFALAAAAVVVLSAAVFGNTLACGFVYDDEFVVAGNEIVTDPENLARIFTTTWWGSHASKSPSSGYRPLAILSFHIDHRIAGSDPRFYHAVNVMLHAAACVLVLLLAGLVTRDALASIVAACLFCLHAVHTEAVASIVGRAEILSAIFVLGALSMHVALPRSRLGWRGAPLGGVLFLAGLLSKESAIALPLLAVAADAILGLRDGRRKDGRKIVAAALPYHLAYAAALASFLFLRLHLFGSISPAASVHFMDNPVTALAPLERIPASVLLFGKAVQLLLVPARLSSDYGYDQLAVGRPFSSALFYVGVAALASIAAAIAAFRRTHPAICFSAAFIPLAFLPVANLILPIHTVFGERTLYTPSIGMCLAAGAAAASLLRKGRTRTAAAAALALYAALLGLRTIVRDQDWKSDYSLTCADVEASPRSVRLLNNHANELMLRGRPKEACAELERAISILDTVPSINANLGLCYLKTGRAADAIPIFEAVLAVEPENPVAARHLPIARDMAGAGTVDTLGPLK